MTIRSDPENNEIRALLNMVDFSGKHILEIGCGDGRLTRRYADEAAHVIAIDPFEQSIRRAKANLPSSLRDQVEFRHATFEEYAAAQKPETFDVAILSWSL